jgi:hypothetical protein
VAELSKESWTDYAVGKVGARSGWFRDDCKPLTVVSHVCHVLTALDVLRVGSIQPQLIYDESRLNTKRILVVWLSPNDWAGAGGFRYGNVSFDLDWPKLIEDKRFYWVGVAEYKPKACRILLTEKDRDVQLLPYRPRKGDGPWWDDRKSGEHRWNGDHCLEFMLEGEIRLSDVKELRFVKHHPERCSMKNQGCNDKGHDSWKGSARLLAGACDRHVLTRWPYLWTTNKGEMKESLRDAWQALSSWACKGIKEWDGPVKAESERAPDLARAGMGALCDLSEKGRRNLFSLFDSEESAVEACAAVIEEDLDLDAGTLPRGYEEAGF